MRAISFACAIALASLWAIGQVLRDATWLSGLCFYIPSPLAAATLLAWTAFHALTKRRRAAAVAALLALAPLYFVLLVENRFFAGATDSSGDIRLVHWNVAGPLPPEKRNVLVGHRADIYVLSEIADRPGLEALRAELGEGYQALLLGNLAVVATGDVESSGWLLDHDRRRVRFVTWTRDGVSLSLLVVDLPSDVSVHRDPLLREINALIVERRPDLVVGDFNAPRRSRALCELPDGYRHAFDAVGSGLGYTWPVPVPMYALDQCIFSSRVVPAKYQLHSTVRSDHRLQVFDFSASSDD
jgi:endonuclease/exonuclease/phosphatase family metal-dependent hydrolase